MAPQIYRLVVRSGPTQGKSFDLTKNEVTIGRDTANDIVINDPEISRKHARLVLQGNGYVLEDLGSTNGTYVDGQRLMGPYVLRPGDTILLGENINLGYEVSQFDPDATLVAQPSPVVIQPPPPQPQGEPAQQPIFRPVSSAQQPYPGGSPPSPFEVPPLTPQEPAENRERIWILAGIGCLVLIGLFIGAVAIVIDQLNLWCQLFPFLSGCVK